MTAKQRRAIYRKAAERVFDANGKGAYAYACHAIARVISSNKDLDLKQFPEFLLFERQGYYAWWYWDEVTPRVLALLLAAEMCE